MRIGLFGGSFSPVHEGHLRLASHALSELNLEKVVFVPAFRPPLKSGEKVLPAALRVKLLRHALKRYPGFELSLCEMERGGVSYTVDTVAYFQKLYGPKVVLYFLTGADTLKDLARWRSLDRILRMCRFVVLSRPGYPIEEVPDGVLVLPFDALDVSASRIRGILKRGEGALPAVPAGTEGLLKAYYRKAA